MDGGEVVPIRTRAVRALKRGLWHAGCGHEVSGAKDERSCCCTHNDPRHKARHREQQVEALVEGRSSQVEHEQDALRV